MFNQGLQIAEAVSGLQERSEWAKAGRQAGRDQL